MLNFFIKNTFIFVPSQGDEARDGAEARSKSAPAKMRSPPEEAPGAPPRDDGAAETNGHIIIAEDTEMADPVPDEGSEASDETTTIESEGDEHDGDQASLAEYVTGHTSMREPGQPVAAPPKIRPSVVLRQQERMVDQFLDEQISKARAEKWDALSQGIVELCAQKFSLNALRIDMLVPKRRIVVHKLCMMHIVRFTGLSPEMIKSMKAEGLLREKGATMEVWVAKKDAQNRELRVFLSAALRFQKAFEDRQVLVQYRGGL